MDLRLDFGAEPEDLHLAVEEDGEEMEPFLKRGQGQNRKFLKIADVDGVGDEVDDARVVGEVEDGDLEFLGKVRGEGDDLLELLDGVADHGDGFNAVVGGLGEAFDADFRAVVFKGLDEADAGESAHEDADGAVGETEGLDESAEDAGGGDFLVAEIEFGDIELDALNVGHGGILVGHFGEDGDEAVAAGGLLDEGNDLRIVEDEGRQREREEDDAGL